jgi:hypothetical protein
LGVANLAAISRFEQDVSIPINYCQGQIFDAVPGIVPIIMEYWVTGIDEIDRRAGQAHDHTAVNTARQRDG